VDEKTRKSKKEQERARKSEVEGERAASLIRLETVTKSQKSDKESGRERNTGRKSVCVLV